MPPQSRGARRERAAKAALEKDGWVVVRTAGSLGPADLVAMRWDQVPRLVQVKSDVSSPYKNFGPDDRKELAALASKAGVEAWLLWWPPRKPMDWRHQSVWPDKQPAA